MSEAIITPDGRRWAIHQGFPCPHAIWINNDGTATYKSRLFAGRECRRRPGDNKHEPPWEWFYEGECVNLDGKYFWLLGKDGEFQQFTSEAEADAAQKCHNLKHGIILDPSRT